MSKPDLDGLRNKVSKVSALATAAEDAFDDVTWPGTFTVDAGALTLVTLFTK